MPRKLTKPWLSSYLDYTAETESPRVFNLWAGISAMSATMKKKVFIQRGFYKIYPNQFVVLVGPPGIGKGTAINPAIDLVKDAGTANFLQDKITAEKIVEKLAKGFSHVTMNAAGQPTGMSSILDSTATIVQTELPILTQGSEWILPLLCELWEKGSFSYETKTKGSFEAKGLCVGLLAGCVPNFIAKLNKDATEAVTGGFTSRCIFVYATQRANKIAWPSMNGNFANLHDDLAEDLKYISQISGDFKFTPDGMDLWREYYKGDTFNIDEFESEMMMGFKARMPAHVIKTAMCLALSEGDKLELSRVQLINAMKLVDNIRKTVDITFRSVGESPLAVAQDRILRYIEMKGFATRKQILHDNYRHITEEDLNRVFLVLGQAGFIVEGEFKGVRGYKHTGKVRP